MKKLYALFVLLSVCMAFTKEAYAQLASCSGSNIGGYVFRELTANGIRDVGEAGIQGVTVKAYSDASLVSTATTLSDGSYALTGLSAGTTYRVEFTWSESYLFPSPVGTSSNTSVRFITAGSCSVNFGLHLPTDFCANPIAFTPCYVNGDPILPGTAQSARWLVYTNYPPGSTMGLNQYIDDGTPVGTVWGGAYQRSTKTLFTSAFLKRHTGLGTLGPSGIYKVDMGAATPTVTPFIKLSDLGISTGIDPRASYPPAQKLSGDKSLPNHDPAAFDAVGKLSFGDIDISEDDRTLWAMNLADGPSRGLIEITVGVPAKVPTAADVTVHGLPAVTCTNGVFRAFALEIHKGMVYIGGVCTGENSGATASNLTASIYRHDPNGADGNFTLVYSFPLNYTRGYISNAGSNKADAEWRPWIKAWTDIVNPAPGQGPWGQVMYPQPMFSDMEFDDDGSIIVAIMDRFGHQGGNQNYSTNVNSTTLYEAAVAGDVLRIFNNNGTYVLENNAGCPTCPGSPVTMGANSTPAQGPGGGEFYWQDMYRLSNDKNAGSHTEISTGSLSFLPGSGEVGLTVFDPVSDYRAAGFFWLSNTTGRRTRSYEIFGLDGGAGQPRVATFGKAASLGDMEILCDPSPIEIGNYVWKDLDQDGVQDPGEQAFASVSVNLYVESTSNPGTYILVGKTTTNASGQYLFNKTNVAIGGVSPLTGNPLTGSFTGLSPFTTYYISINNSTQFNTGTMTLDISGKNWKLTTQNASGNTMDLRDSDGALSAVGGAPFNGYPTIVANVGGSGQNDHTFDFGFYENACRVLTGLSATASTVCSDDPVSFSLAYEAGSVGTFRLLYSTTPLSATDLYISNLGTVINASVNVTPAQNFTNISNYTFPTNNSGSSITYYVYGILNVTHPSYSATCRPVVSATITVLPETRTVTVSTPSNTLCSIDNGANENVLDLNVLLSGSGVGFGTWVETSVIPSGGFNAGTGVLTATVPMEGITYTFTYTIPGVGNGDCGTRTYTVFVTVNNCPCTTNQVSLCPGETYTATATVTGGTGPYSNFKWFKDGVEILGETNSTLVISAQGQYYYTCTDGNGCNVQLYCPINVISGIASATLSTNAITICNVDLGNRENVYDLASLIILGNTTGTWENGLPNPPPPGTLLGQNNSVFVASFGMASNTYNVNYRIPGTNGCADLVIPITITVNNCSCPQITSVITPSVVCSEDLFSVTINHTLAPGDLAIYYNSGALLPDANAVYNNATLLTDLLSEGANSTQTFGISLAPGTYHIYAVLRSDNPELFIDPACRPMASTTITVNAPTASVDLADPNAICNVNQGANDNQFDLDALVLSGPTNGTWAVVSPGGGSIGAGNIYTAPIIAGTYQISYTITGIGGPGTGVCNDQTYTISIQVNDCSCPIVQLTNVPAVVCSNGSFNFTYNHTANPGQLALYYILDNGMGLTPAQLYSPGAGGATLLGAMFTPVANTSSTVVTRTLPQNTSDFNVSYLIYGVLASGNSMINNPVGCYPVAIGNVVVQPETPPATVTPLATICEANFGNQENVINLNSLITAGPTTGTWQDDDNTGQLVGSLFTATAAMANGTYNFTYVISGAAGSGVGNCNNRTYTVAITVNMCTTPCPEITASIPTNTICGNTIDITIDHSANFGNLAVYVTTDGSVSLNDFYSLIPPPQLILAGTVNTTSSTMATVTANIPANMTSNNLEYFVFVALAPGNPNINNPYCRPLIYGTELRFIQYAETPTATVTSMAEVCDVPGLNSVSLNSLITAGSTDGTWTETTVPNSNGIVNDVFTYTTSMGNGPFTFEYRIQGNSPDPTGDCSDQVYTVTISVNLAKCRVSIGSTVFFDVNNNGLDDGAGDVGINGVIMELWGTGPDGIIGSGDDVQIITGADGLLGTADDSAADPVVTSTVSGEAGTYFFGNLLPGNYYVKIPGGANFAGPLLATPFSSTNIATSGTDNNVDNDDNGNQTSGIGTAVTSSVINLFPGAETINETGPGGTQDDTYDSNGNMTVDFGFVPDMSIGSTVFNDPNNNGIQDLTNPLENGIAGVGVVLYFDADNDGFITGAEATTPIATTITDANGNYIFDSLIPGNYIVGIPVPDASAQTSSTGATTTDNIDLNDDGTQTGTGNPTLSGIVNLAPGAEPTQALGNELDENPGATQDNTADANGNMTIDFGFVPTMSIGSTVFADVNNDGIQQTTNPLEDGISGVTVSLYYDANNDGNIDGLEATTPVLTTVTDANGNYYFPNLPEGNYQVGVTPPGSAPVSSTPDLTADGVDGNDNGSQPGGTGTQILSNIVNLNGASETSNELNQGGTADDANDSNGDMTIDFGLVPNMSIGSTVFYDNNNDNIQSGANEIGISGVTVQLLYDANNDGMITGAELTPVATDITDASGNYFFGTLPAGNYQVIIPTTPAGAPLSSTDPVANADNNTDNDDDGNQEGGTGTAVSSSIINLVSGAEPLDGAETGPGGLQDNTVANPDSNGNMTVDFGFIPMMSLGSTVFYDVDNDGIQDPTNPLEGGIAGVTVYLYDMTGTSILDSTITDAEGNYLFDSLSPGTYVVGVVAPDDAQTTSTPVSGDDDVDGNNNGNPVVAGISQSAPIVLTAGGETADEPGQGGTQDDASDVNGNMTVDFGFIPSMSIGSTVYYDNNNNGAHDTLEIGIPNVVVSLLVDVNGDGTIDPSEVIATTVTDVNGTYLFDTLPAGDYIVAVTPATQANTSSTTAVAADDNGGDGLNNGTQTVPGATAYSPVITLEAGTEPDAAAENNPFETLGAAQDDADELNGDMTVDFGFIPMMSLGSTVFYDVDNDGIQDPTNPLEGGIAGVTVYLYDMTGTSILDSTITDAEGNYLFDSLSPGTYVVGVVAPDDAQTTSTPVSGDDDVDGNNNGNPVVAGISQSAPIVLTAGGETADEPGQGGTQDDASDVNGNMTVDFGFIPSMSIGSTVYYDNNNNGAHDTLEIGIPNVVVSLLVDVNGDGTIDPSEVIATTVTDVNGTYLFDTLPAGDYIVAVTPATQANTSSTTAVAADDNGGDGLNNGTQTVPGATAYSPVITLEAGTEPDAAAENNPFETLGAAQDDADELNGDMTVDFGFIPMMSLGSTVFYDVDNDGIQDPTNPLEGGIAGVTVYLYDMTGTSILDSTITDAEGNYLFDSLSPGTYVVGVVAPDDAQTTSTPVSGDDDVDGNNNGNPVVAGISQSAPIVLTAGGETANEPGQGGTQDDASDVNGNMTVDFGFIPSMSIGSTVYYDNNNNGAHDTLEIGIPNVVVSLLVDVNGDGTIDPSEVIATTVTDVNGTYLFDTLPAGDYIVAVTPATQANTSSTTAVAADDNGGDGLNNGTQTVPGATAYSPVITLEAGTEPDAAAENNPFETLGAAQDDADELNGDMTVDFGFIPMMSLGSTVFYDVDNDGIQDPTNPLEGGIAGVTVYLYDMTGTSILDSTITDAEGNYLFDSLSPGTYVVGVVAPDDAQTTSTPVSGDDDVDGNNNGNPVVAGISQSAPIVLTAGGETADEPGQGGTQDDASDVNGNMTVDFGFIPSMSIGSTVYYDNNNNGAHDTLEIGIPNVVVSLLVDVNGDGTIDPSEVIATTVTDVNGTYLFDTLPAGDYIVAVTPATQANTSSTTAVAADDNGGDGLNNGTQTVPGATAYSPVITLEAGTEPDAAAENNPFETLGAAQDDADELNGDMTVDFGFIPMMSLGSTVFYDVDNDGIQDPTNPLEGGIAGVTVYLYDMTGTSILDSTITDAEGNYLFDSLSPGTYVVGVVAPDDAQTTSTPVSGDDDVDGNNNGNPVVAGISQSAPIVLTAGGETANEPGQGGTQDDASDVNGNMTVDFGFIPSMSIGSTVYYDNNNNGAHDTLEIGIPNVVVSLLVDVNGDGTIDPSEVIATTVTDVNGTYLFDTLPAGDYIVAVTPATQANTSSTTAVAADDNGGDGLNNGTQTVPGATAYSPVITLEAGTEPDAAAENNPFETLGAAQDDADELNGDMTVDFGFIPMMSLGSTVFYDVDNDGIQDPTNPLEGGIAGVTVYLYDMTGTSILDSTITDAEGNYLFDSLSPGTYVVGVVAPDDAQTTSTPVSGDDDVDGNNNGNPVVAGISQSAPIVLTAGGETADEPGQGGTQDDASDVNGNMTVDFGFIPSMSIGSTVYYDNNNNGAHDTLEIGIPNVVVSLLVDVNGDGTIDPSEVIATTVTDVNGTYLFDTLPAGDYIVAVTPATQANTSSTTAVAADDNGGDGLNNGTQTVPGATAYSPVITLEAGTEPDAAAENNPFETLGAAQDDADELNGDMTVDFGFIPMMSLGSTVFYDVDNDGIQDPTNPLEGGIAGVTVYLYDMTGTSILDSTITDAEGNYLFDSLSPGTYVVGVVAPDDAQTTSTPVSGDDDVDGNNNGNPVVAGISQSAPIVLTAGGETANEPGQGGTQDDASDVNGNMTVDFGFIPSMSIGSTVYYDNNDNGEHDLDEEGIPGVFVSLLIDLDGNGTIEPTEVIETVLTDANGNYLFDTLPAGEYIVAVTPTSQAGSSSSVSYGDDNGGDGQNNGTQPGGDGTTAFSAVITLVGGMEPLDATENNGEEIDGGLQDLDDANGDMTIDFGFVPDDFDLALIKLLAPGQSAIVEPGDTINYVITVINQGFFAVDSIEITDYLPTEMSFDATLPGNSIWVDGGATISTVIFDFAGQDSLAAGQTVQIPISLVLNSPLIPPGSIVRNEAEISEFQDDAGNVQEDTDSTPDADDENDNELVDNDVNGNGKQGGDEDDHDWAEVTIEGFDLALVKLLSAGQDRAVEPGDTISFDIIVINQGMIPADSVLITDYVPAGLNFDASLNPTWVDNGGLIQTTLAIADGEIPAGGLLPGQSDTVQILLVLDSPLPAGTRIENFAEISSATDENGDPQTDIDSNPDTVDDDTYNQDNEVSGNGNEGEDEDDHDGEEIVIKGFDLALIKTLADGQASLVSEGDDVTFRITILNQGMIAADSIVIQDYIPAGFTLNDADWTANAGGAEIVLSVANGGLTSALAADSSVTVDITLTVDNPLALDLTPLVNVAEIAAALDEDGNPVEDIDSDMDDMDDDVYLTDNEVNGNGKAGSDEDDHDKAQVDVLIPEIGVAKRVTNITQLPDGSADVSFEFNIENLGNSDIDSIHLIDSLVATFGAPCTFEVLSLTSGKFIVNPAYDGDAVVEMIDFNSSKLVAGDKGSVLLTINVANCDSVGPFFNTAYISGIDELGEMQIDTSVNGQDPDQDGDGFVDEESPTPIEFTEEPQIGVSKNVASGPTINADGSYDLTFEIRVENDGAVNLDSLQIIDSLINVFGDACMFEVTSLSSEEFEINPAYDGGITDAKLLIDGGEMKSWDEGAVLVGVKVGPCTMLDTFFNSAVATALTPNGVMLIDSSQNGTEPDPDGDLDPTNNNEPTPIILLENPVLGIAKRLVSLSNNADGSATVEFEFNIENFGNVDMDSIQIIDSLGVVFDPCAIRPGSIRLTSSMSVNTAFDGILDYNLLDGTDKLRVGDKRSVLMTFIIDECGGVDSFSNTAYVTGVSPIGTEIIDTSYNGSNADPNNDDNPDEEEPTPVVLEQEFAIGLAKRVTNAVLNADGSFRVTYEFNIENFSTTDVDSLQVTDDLTATFLSEGCTNVTVQELESDDFQVNPGYNGTSDLNMLTGLDIFLKGDKGAINMTLLVEGCATFATTDTFYNTAIARAVDPNGVPLTDESTDGSDPDPNEDGNPSENEPTPLSFVENPGLEITKRISERPYLDGQNNFLFTYEIRVVNTGDVDINNIQITDSLAAVFALSDSVVLLGVESEEFEVNPAFDGDLDVNLLTGLDTLESGNDGAIYVRVQVTVDTPYVGPFINVATANGLTPTGVVLNDADSVAITLNCVAVDKEDPILMAGIPEDITVSCESPMPNDTFHLMPHHVMDMCTPNDRLIIEERFASSRVMDPADCGYYNYTDSIFWTVTDEAGNDMTWKQYITWIDTTAPIVKVPPTFTINACNIDNIDPMVTGFATGMDNCAPSDVLTITYRDSLEIVCKGEKAAIIHRIWRIEDPCGNADSMIQDLLILDQNPPDVDFVEDITMSLDKNGLIQLDINDVVASFNDACYTDLNDLQTSISKRIFNCNDLGVHELLVTVANPCNNKQALAIVRLTVIDTVAPVLMCPVGDITISMEAGACTAALPSLNSLLMGPDCGVKFTTSPNIDGGLAPGAHLITVTATDASGNSSTCTLNIVVDGQLPSTKDMACQGSLNLSLNSECVASITPDMLVIDHELCTQFLCVEITDLKGNPHPNFFDISDLHQQFKVSIIDCNGEGNRCWGLVTIEEKLIPDVAWPADTTLLCVEPTTPDYSKTGRPVVLNCVQDWDIKYSDVFTKYDPCDPIRALIERTWILTDTKGNVITHVQNIRIMPFSTNHVRFPEDIGIDDPINCTEVEETKKQIEEGEIAANSPIHPNQTGAPNIFGIPLDLNSGLCLYSMRYDDEVYEICDGSYEILRTWKIRNTCDPTNTTLDYVQSIVVYDKQAPSFVKCFNDQKVSTVSHSCEYKGSLPIPTADMIGESCGNYTFDAYVTGGGYITFTGSIAAGTLRIQAHEFEKGVHEVTYILKDNCYNISLCKFKVIVSDKTGPVASAKEYITVSLTRTGVDGESGVAKVTPEMINNASYDNCTDVYLEVRRDDEAPACLNEGDLWDHDNNPSTPMVRWNNNVTYNGIINGRDEANPQHEHDRIYDTDKGQYVKVCCEDIGKEVKVWLRVWDDASGDGVYGNDGDNFNETWAIVHVEDKIVPRIVACKAEVSIDCNDTGSITAYNFQSSTGPFVSVVGKVSSSLLPTLESVCGNYELEFRDAGSLNTCNTGTFTRTYRVKGFPSVTCTQVITVEGITQSPVLEHPISLHVWNKCTLTEEDVIANTVRLSPMVRADVYGQCEKYDNNTPATNASMTAAQRAAATTNGFTPNEGPLGSSLRNQARFNANYKNVGCTVFGTKLTIEEFTVGDACKKWLVRWDYINWCDNSNAGCRQTIYKFEDTTAPVITSCPGADVDIADATCEVALILKPTATDELCDNAQTLTWRVRIYEGTNIGINPTQAAVREITNITGSNPTITFNGSGMRAPLKAGTYTVRYFVTDGCGNVSECDAIVGIWAKAPTPYCVSISSAVMKNGLVELWARDFDKGSFTNCGSGVMLFTFNRGGAAEHPAPAQLDRQHYFTGFGNFLAFKTDAGNATGEVAARALYNEGKAQLWLPEVTVRPRPSLPNGTAQDPERIVTGGTSGMNFGCKVGNNIGAPIDAEMRVWDMRSFKAGTTQGSDFCSTKLSLIDNQGGCGEGNIVTISGTINTESVEKMKDVEVTLGSDLPEYPIKTKTDKDGTYTFGNLPIGVAYNITPKKEGDYANGVNTLDLVQIQRHILGIKKLDNPYKMIAADADGDQAIRVNDIVEIRKLILGITDKYSTTPSWRFVDGSDKMDQGPWPFREVISHASLIEAKVDNNFIAVKIGDTDGTASANAISKSTQPRSAGVRLSVEDRAMKVGEEVEISLTAEQFNEVHGMQLTLSHEGLELVNIDGRAIEMTADHVGKVSKDKTTMSWASANGTTVAQGSEIMRMKFRATKAQQLSNALQITSEVTGAEAYVGSDMERSGIILEVRGKEGRPFEVAQNEPNPWKTTTVINYTLPQAGAVKLTILDVTGRIIRTFDSNGDAGQNQITVTREQLNGAAGVLIYKVESGAFSAQRKMLVIE
jgi:uncharacterized repeat protein (TIGR01451 family)